MWTKLRNAYTNTLKKKKDSMRTGDRNSEMDVSG